MTESMSCCAVRGCSPAVYCGNCDLLVGLEGLHVLEVVAAEERLRVRVESPPGLMGCPACGVVALSHGRREVQLIDAPCFGRPVTVVWWKRTWCCPEPLCPVAVFTESLSAGRGGRPPAGLADDASRVVGSTAAAAGARLHLGAGPPARDHVEDGMELDPTVARGAGRRPDPVRRSGGPWRR